MTIALIDACESQIIRLNAKSEHKHTIRNMPNKGAIERFLTIAERHLRLARLGMQHFELCAHLADPAAQLELEQGSDIE